MNTTFSEILMNGLNDPNCSFYVGGMVGQAYTFKIVITLFILYFVYKIIDKFAFEPLLNYIKNKIYRKKKNDSY